MIVRYRLGLRIVVWVLFLLYVLLVIAAEFQQSSLAGLVVFAAAFRSFFFNRYVDVDPDRLISHLSNSSYDLRDGGFVLLEDGKVFVVANRQKRRAQIFAWMAPAKDWEAFTAWVAENQPPVLEQYPLHVGPAGRIWYPIQDFLGRHARTLKYLFAFTVLSGIGWWGYGIWERRQEISGLFERGESAAAEENWHEALELARILEDRLHGQNDKLLERAWDLRTRAAGAIRPRLALRATWEGVEVPATVRIDGMGEREVLTLPATWPAQGPNRRYILFPSAERKGQWLQSPLFEIVTDWEGLRELEIELEPYTGEAPVRGENWRSLSTGMEFVWVEDLGMAVGKFEVTNAEYRKSVPDHDSGSFEGHRLNGARQPAVRVSFAEAVAYAEWLTLSEYRAGQLPHGYHYRLPSVAEMQAMHRLGQVRQPNPWNGGWPPPEGIAINYSGRESPAEERADDWQDDFPVSAPVDELWINPWGLAGVAGNVWEISSWYGKDLTCRYWHGGAWTTDPHTLPASLRDVQRLVYPIRGNTDQEKNHDGGFRLVLSR